MTELVLTRGQWNSILRALVESSERVLVGPTGMHRAATRRRILVRSVHAVSREEGSRLVRGWGDVVWIDRLGRGRVHPLGGPAVREIAGTRRRRTVLAVGVDREAGAATGFTVLAGEYAPLERIEVVCGGPSWGAGSPDGEVELFSRERWSRTTGALGRDAWSRLSRAAVGIVGCGRSGSVIAHTLCLQGVARLVLVDPDVLEEGNLDATVGVVASDVGKPKVDAVRRTLCVIRPDLRVLPVRRSAHEVAALELLRDVDLIVSAVDRDMPRLAAAYVASAYLLPHLDIGTGIFRNGGGERQMGVEIRFLLPGAGCVRCVGGLRRDAEAREELFRPATSPGPARRTVPWSTERAGSLLPLNLVAVGRALGLWFDALGGRVAESRRVRTEWDGEGRELIEEADVGARPGCAICGAAGLGDYRFGEARGKAIG